MEHKLKFILKDKEYSLSLIKLNRKELYGWKNFLPYDVNNDECNVSSVDESDVPEGEMSLGMIDDEGKSIDESELIAADDKDDSVPLMFSAPITLSSITTIEDFLDHSITSVYLLKGEDEHSEFVEAIQKDGIYTFVFNQRADYEGDPAFIIESEGNLYVLVGKKIEIEFLNLSQSDSIEECDNFNV